MRFVHVAFLILFQQLETAIFRLNTILLPWKQLTMPSGPANVLHLITSVNEIMDEVTDNVEQKVRYNLALLIFVLSLWTIFAMFEQVCAPVFLVHCLNHGFDALARGKCWNVCLCGRRLARSKSWSPFPEPHYKESWITLWICSMYRWLRAALLAWTIRMPSLARRTMSWGRCVSCWGCVSG